MGRITLSHRQNLLGCDPEFFFKTKSGSIVGSEKIISGRGVDYKGNKNKVTIDGVQAELNPRESNCREILKNEIVRCFNKIKVELRKRTDIIADFSEVVEVSKKELNSLSEQSRIFGCAPDYNIYSNKMNQVKVNPSTYRKRSAGGHIHLGPAYEDCGVGGCSLTQMLGETVYVRSEYKKGLNLHVLKNGMPFSVSQKEFYNANLNSINKISLKGTALALQLPKRIIPILDVVLGNTCVLLNRSNGAIERRMIYGKAGDFRYTPYGLEYRTLSNFWLRSYPIMSFVFGMARTALQIVADSIDYDNDAEKRILKAIKFSRIERAINRNDFKLAQDNFNQIKGILLEKCKGFSHHPISTSTIKEFKYVVETGIDYWFKDDPLKHWTTGDNVRDGWESFCCNRVRPEMQRSLMKEVRLGNI